MFLWMSLSTRYTTMRRTGQSLRIASVYNFVTLIEVNSDDPILIDAFNTITCLSSAYKIPFAASIVNFARLSISGKR